MKLTRKYPHTNTATATTARPPAMAPTTAPVLSPEEGAPLVEAAALAADVTAEGNDAVWTTTEVVGITAGGGYIRLFNADPYIINKNSPSRR
jgi:hypothetical protein